MTTNPHISRSIAAHGLIGDQHSAALVSADGAVDFFCWPHFDSPTLFADLLDQRIGGVFELAPVAAEAEAGALQSYVPQTNVLLTRWQSATGCVEVTDLLPWPTPPGFPPGTLIRRVRGVAGHVAMRLTCAPRPDYARCVPEAVADAWGVVFTPSQGTQLRLSSTQPLSATEGAAVAMWEMQAGEAVYFALHPASLTPPGTATLERLISETIAAWQAWSAQIIHAGPWRAAVIRSALALKLLVSARSGAILAAPSFGLPETPGGARNWDYRACWIRDGSLIANAFLGLGLAEEAAGFHAFVAGCARLEPGRLPIMLALDGGAVADEAELPHLAGYGGARPVRIGNGARDQLQLDIHGEYLDSLARAGACPDGAELGAIIDYISRHWRDIDAGIWELRGGPRAHLHSRLLCWVALDRAIGMARAHHLAAPLSAWAALRDEIAADIWARFRHPEHGYFVQSAGGRDLDAAQLMMPMLGFVDGRDPVWRATLDAIVRELVADGLVWRYRNADGLPGEEASFAPCMFWLVSCLALAGEHEAARAAMARAVGRANALGLFAEEIAACGTMLGNFPQGLTHAALIEAAIVLAALPEAG